jgi:hypothetical protein
VVLEKDGEDQFDRSREKKQAFVIQNNGGEEYPANNKKKKG